MKNCRGEFLDFLRKIGYYSSVSELLFERYYHELLAENQKVNLFSRKMDLDEVWVRHFLDSISVFEVYQDFSGKQVLDFGTGGGLPGLPIKILAPDAILTLLDSTKKKVDAVRGMVDRLRIDGVKYIWCRLEAPEMKQYYGSFDVIVCRGVKITAELSKVTLRLLKKNGKIILYKAVELEDVDRFEDVKVHELEIDGLGVRKIVLIRN